MLLGIVSTIAEDSALLDLPLTDPYFTHSFSYRHALTLVGQNLARTLEAPIALAVDCGRFTG
jgi:hypothetical protein